jgi:hypothetical protein
MTSMTGDDNGSTRARHDNRGCEEERAGRRGKSSVRGFYRQGEGGGKSMVEGKRFTVTLCWCGNSSAARLGKKGMRSVASSWRRCSTPLSRLERRRGRGADGVFLTRLHAVEQNRAVMHKRKEMAPIFGPHMS